MVDRLDQAFRFQEQALNLRAYRQQVLASNVANADTPNYKARDIDFNVQLEAAVADSKARDAGALAATSPGHLQARAGANASSATLKYRVPAQANLDGNTVEMDAERAQFIDNALHYETGLTVLGMQIRNLLSAIQGQ
jgi:flagellar basal-body rod protein FlgB